jgi:hypothetical protein
MIRKVLLAVTTYAMLVGLPLSGSALAGSRLMADFTPGKCLDIVNDGQNNKLKMATCGRFLGQDWTATPSDGRGFKLRNRFSGPNKCLDVVNDGQNNRLIMADCGNYSGQYWSIPTAGKVGPVRNGFTGAGKCLDIINDGRNDRLTMADCGNYSGQKWGAGPY